MKSAFKSKTMWFGAIQIAIGLAGLLLGVLPQEQSWSLIMTGATTMGLRVVTAQPLR